jgi:hypothetical protein
MSPSHHVRQTEPMSSASISPPASRLPTPTVALTIVLTTPASTTSAITSLTLSSEGRKSANRCRRYAPARASSVLPVVIPRTVWSGTPVQAFARKAPSATPGHSR